MATFGTTAYSAASKAYNAKLPTYIDGTAATVPASGTATYSGLFGNVMCAFAVDGGDSVLGGNAIVTGALNLAGGMTAITSSTVASAALGSYALVYPTPTTVVLAGRLYHYKFNGDILNYASGTGVADATANATPVYSYALVKEGASSYSFTGGTLSYTAGTWLTLPSFTRPSTLSVCFWIYTTVTGVVYRRVFDYGTFRLYLNISSNGFKFNETITMNTSSFLNTWAHIAITVSDLNCIYYCNGAQIGTGTLTTAMTGITTSGFMGHSVSSGDTNFDGLLDDFRIYSVVLTAAQVSLIYSGSI